MKSNKVTQLTTEELAKQKKLMTGALIGFCIVLIIAYSILTYLMVRNNDFTLVTIIPLGFVTLMPAIIRLSQINAEIKLRNNR